MEIRPLPDPLIRYAEAEIARLQVPGAAAAVLHEGVIYAGGVGITNVEHPLPVTAETLFQIGSTSKTFTATALMALVEAGRVDLDAPVRAYLPWFALQSEDDAARLTVRDLATHHAGYVGDYFKDTGRGDDAIGAIVRKMANSPQLVPAGYTFSYSNAAFYVLGHIVETVHGRPFEQVIRDTIFEPLGMDRSFYFPEEAITHRVAAGHIVTTDGPKVARPWNTPRSIAPGGGVTSNVIDQARYAALHLGLAPEANVLRRGTVAAMQQVQRPERRAPRQVPQPPACGPLSWSSARFQNSTPRAQWRVLPITSVRACRVRPPLRTGSQSPPEHSVMYASLSGCASRTGVCADTSPP